MKAVIQRASQAHVSIEGNIIGKIAAGLVVLIGIENADSSTDIDWLVGKIAKLRIFDDADGIMNRSLLDVGGDALVISQFTLHASTKKGNRPSYIMAARPETAIPLYEEFVSALSDAIGKPCQTGKFGADMQVTLTNDGPVTIIIDTKNKI